MKLPSTRRRAGPRPREEFPSPPKGDARGALLSFSRLMNIFTTARKKFSRGGEELNFLLRNFETRKRKGKEKKRRRICVSRRDIEIHRDREIAVPSSPIRIRLATLGSSHKYLPRIRTQSALYADPSETYGDFLNYGSRDPG